MKEALTMTYSEHDGVLELDHVYDVDGNELPTEQDVQDYLRMRVEDGSL